jgi:hypothetical protein
MYNFYRNRVRKLCKSARHSYYDKKILNTRESSPKKWYDNIKSISGLSKSEPFSCIFHDGEFKRGPELAELIAESFCVACFKRIGPTLLQQASHYTCSWWVHNINPTSRNRIGKDQSSESNWPRRHSELGTEISCTAACWSNMFHLNNTSIAQGRIPALWKSADVTPVPKISNPKSVDSDLRPISLTRWWVNYWKASFFGDFLIISNHQ